MKNKNSKGFTLAELLVVVAIIAVLVAISIPVFTSQLHKTKAATDMANVRALYSELQVDFLNNGEINSNYLTEEDKIYTGDSSIEFPDGSRIELQTGTATITGDKDKGYAIIYLCSKYNGTSDKHYLVLSN